MESKAKLTPMMKQYFDLKSKYSEEILFFRLGDFYEMFANDALNASKILGITLTARHEIPMCGIPYHSSAGYIAKLIKAGKKIAICEQLSDPNLPGIVKRDVVRIITPGTTLDENILDSKKSNYLAAIVCGAQIGKEMAVCLTDLSTGEMKVLEAGNVLELLDEIEKFRPAEFVLNSKDLDRNEIQLIKKHLKDKCYFSISNLLYETADSILVEQFGLLEMEKAGLENKPELKLTLAMIVNYLKETQKTELSHLKEIEIQSRKAVMSIDEATLKNLEILENLREKRIDGSLLSVLDKTVTGAGSRALRQVLVSPLLDIEEINKRLELIEFLIGNQNLLLDIRLILKDFADLERVLGRISLGNGNARDLKMMESGFGKISEMKLLLEKGQNIWLKEMKSKLDELSNLRETLSKAIVDEPPILTREGGMIRDGFDQSLDELRQVSSSGKGYIQGLQKREIERTGISSLKVKFNKIFGYYIEISNANLSQVPADYTRKQTMANCERFSTPELKEYEEKVLTAEEKIFEIESDIFEKLCQEVKQKSLEIKKNCKIMSWLDLMCSLALCSWENKYCKPEISEEDRLEIADGRHPVIEKLNPYDQFIGNNLNLNEKERLMLITGPNMGGKSTFLRQNALIVLMAQIGCFVPASRAHIGIVDRIFTRVGASDNLVRGQSTFWLEMEETSLILAKATNRSLLILDEIGRGTSTYDGVSIAWAILEFIHNNIGAKTLFASHYHELIKLAETLPRSVNFSVLAKENEKDGVVFLYKIVRGGVDRSYGIEVARLAGLPEKVIQRAKEILIDLEAENIGTGQASLEFTVENENARISELMEERKHSGLDSNEKTALENIKNLDLNSVSPLELMKKIDEIKKTI